MQAMPNNPLIKTEENEEKNPSKTNTLGPKTNNNPLKPEKNKNEKSEIPKQEIKFSLFEVNLIYLFIKLSIKRKTSFFIFIFIFFSFFMKLIKIS